MSDYTAPDKAAGTKWTWQEHNAMKTAVNSKMDKDKLVQNLNNPNANEFPSTNAVSNFVSNYFSTGAGSAAAFAYHGDLDGSEAIVTSDNFQKSGWWMGVDGFDTITTNAQYPVKQPGLLRVFIGKNYKVMEYITISDNPRYFIKTSLSAWVEIATANYLTTNNYCQCTAISTPTTTGINTTKGTPVSVTKAGDGTWNKAKLTVASEETIATTDVVDIVLTFEENIENKIVFAQNFEEKLCDITVAAITENSIVFRASNFSEREDSLQQFSFIYSIG